MFCTLFFFLFSFFVLADDESSEVRSASEEEVARMKYEAEVAERLKQKGAKNVEYKANKGGETVAGFRNNGKSQNIIVAQSISQASGGTQEKYGTGRK